jgi:hypothetical protein
MKRISFGNGDAQTAFVTSIGRGELGRLAVTFDSNRDFLTRMTANVLSHLRRTLYVLSANVQNAIADT